MSLWHAAHALLPTSVSSSGCVATPGDWLGAAKVIRTPKTRRALLAIRTMRTRTIDLNREWSGGTSLSIPSRSDRQYSGSPAVDAERGKAQEGTSDEPRTCARRDAQGRLRVDRGRKTRTLGCLWA